MAQHILLAEDETKTARRLQRGLALEGYSVETVGDGRAVLNAIRDRIPDLVLLSTTIPVIDGIEVTHRLRSAQMSIPIIMLTHQATSDEEVASLDSGADDYLPSNRLVEELLAHVRVQLRHQHDQMQPSTLSYKQLLLDRNAHEVSYAGCPINLTAIEFGLLELLLQQPRRVVRRDELYNHIWGYDYGADSNVLETHISALRHKIRAAGGPQLIQTVRSVGYVLRE